MPSNIDLSSLNIPLSYPFLFLIFIAIVLLLCSAFAKFHRSFYTTMSALALFVSAFLVFSNVNTPQGLDSKAFLDTLNNDIVSFYSSLVILSFSFLYLLMQKEEKQGEFYSLFLFMVASFLLMVSSSNLVLIFIGLESSSLALYTLIAMRGSNNAISSAIKYFSVAAVGSGFFVLSSALIYIKTGSLDIQNILVLNSLKKEPLILSAGVLIFVLCGIKLSLVPFHFWLKDVYYSAHTNLVAFISVVPKIAMFAVVIRILNFLNSINFEIIIAVLVIFSMLAAAIAALSQKDIKKMFAYSSVVHSSFVLAGMIPLLDFSSAEKSLILNATFAYWVLFAFANYALFLLLSFYQKSSYESLNGLLAKKPLIALSASICTLSLAGIPPFGVFWGKVMILTSLINSNYWYIALCIALASVIMLYMYLKLIIHMLFIKQNASHSFKLDFKQSFILVLCVGISVFAVLFML